MLKETGLDPEGKAGLQRPSSGNALLFQPVPDPVQKYRLLNYESTMKYNYRRAYNIYREPYPIKIPLRGDVSRITVV
jgi:hypothetical protein